MDLQANGCSSPPDRHHSHSIETDRVELEGQVLHPNDSLHDNVPPSSRPRVDKKLRRSIESDGQREPIGDLPPQQQQGTGLGSYFRIFKFCDSLDICLYSVGITSSIVSGTASPLMTVIFGSFTSKFTQSGAGALDSQALRQEANTLALWFIYLFIGRLVINYIANITVSFAAFRTTCVIRKRLLECTLRQEIWYFDGETTGSIASQITTNGNRINQGIAEKLASTVQALATFFSAFVVAFIVQWKLTFVTICIVPAILIILSISVTVITQQESRMVKAYSQATVLAQEALGSMKTVHTFWAQEKLIKQYNALLTTAREEGDKKSPVAGVLAATQQFCLLSGTALAFWQGFRKFQSGEIDSSGTVLTVVLSVTLGASSMMQVLPQLESIAGASSAAAELLHLIEKPSLLDPLSPRGERPVECFGDIQISGLDFAYPTRSTVSVLHNLDLCIPAGKTTALVGASGCGKSTVVSLLDRWYVPQSGSILLDGINLASYNIKWLRSNIRLVQQEPILFSGTIYENIAKGFLDSQQCLPTDEKLRLVKEACKVSNAYNFIEHLPHGYDTEVGESASMLSGGQKQRIAIARSIISDPKVLLLDEATSALDAHAEGIVQDALDKISKNRTTLVIAHKLATIKNADNIAVLENGKVLEQGTHKELLKQNGRYASLVRAQDLGAHTKAGQGEDLRKTPMSNFNTLPQESFTEQDRHVRLKPFEQDQCSGIMDQSLLGCLYILLKEQKELHRLCMLAIPASAIAGAIFTAQAVLFSQLINVFTLPRHEGRHRANLLALMLFMVSLVATIAYCILGWVCNLISQRSTYRYRSELFRSFISQDLEFFDRPENASGALASKLTSVPSALQEILSINLFLIVMLLVNMLTSTTLALTYGWKLGLVVVLTGMPVLIGCGYARLRFEQQLEKKTAERFATSAALATEAVISIRTVASFTLEGQICDEYSAMLSGMARSSFKAMIWTFFGHVLSQSLEFLLLALGFWYGAQLLARAEYTVTQFFMVFLAVLFGGQAAGQIFGYTMSMVAARSAANYILWLRSLQPSINDSRVTTPIKGMHSTGITVEEVDFAYQQRKSFSVLEGVNMKVPIGSYVACVGPSGCGKSTLIALIERLYEPANGRIQWNSNNINTITLSTYRRGMSLVQQEPTLFQTSVRENISLGLDYNPSDEEILEACNQANVRDFVLSLPEGLDTLCGSKGSKFSGGQRQRIAIARALIRKPQVLLLDEATSALDTESERAVQETLDNAISDRTTVAAAHRLSTIRHADCIFVFSNGRIVEHGTHEELRNSRGQYYEMCLAQSLDDCNHDSSEALPGIHCMTAD